MLLKTARVVAALPQSYCCSAYFGRVLCNLEVTGVGARSGSACLRTHFHSPCLDPLKKVSINSISFAWQILCQHIQVCVCVLCLQLSNCEIIGASRRACASFLL